MQGSLLQLVLGPEAFQIIHQLPISQRHICSCGCLVSHPYVVQGLLGCEPVFWIHLQQHANQVLRVLRNVLPIRCIETEVAEAHFGKHIGIGFAIERRIPTKHNVHDDSETPQVGALVVLACQHLWSHIIRRASFCCENLILCKFAGKPKVNHFQCRLLDRILVGEQEIFWLQVTVANVVLMHVKDCPEHMLHDGSCLRLSEMTSIDNAVEQLSACAQLHD
mmetsp:Transcript_106141/g.165699  ORF Transcript_106141/g.165699 Transcript_106141/m.165699 type:complete len:221 (+) Transcript_106141:641-1303(+)